MYALEILFVLITTTLLVALNTRLATHRTCFIVFLAGLITVGLAVLLGQARIHMAPAVLVFVFLSVLLLKRGYSHIAVRSVGVTLGLVLVITSVSFALALPVVTLPAPDGPHTVGVTSFTLVDEARDESVFGAPEKSREIYVQVWYPGEMPEEGPAPAVRSLWEELYRPTIFELLFGYLGGIDTHSYEDIPVARGQNSYPAIVFSPALAGIAEQNTLLMEHLASHGYIIFGVTHPYFGMFTSYSDGSGVPVSDKVMEAMSKQGSVDLNALMTRSERAGSSVERARIVLEYFEQGTMLDQFMEIWVRDLGLLVNAITMRGDELPVPAVVARADTDRLGFVGMSYGGGAVTEFCKVDARCRAVMNLDGGLWGSRTQQPLQVPYLVLASSENRKFFQYGLLTSEAPYYLLMVEGATHANFTDVSAFVPLFDWIGVTGPIEGDRAIEIMNTVSQSFFNSYLRAGTEESPDFGDLPEVNIQTREVR